MKGLRLMHIPHLFDEPKRVPTDLIYEGITTRYLGRYGYLPPRTDRPDL